MQFWYRLIIVLCIFLRSNSGYSYNCVNIISNQEKLKNIPDNLLLAIAMTESGRKVGKQIIPWPWSINVNGKGYSFANKQDAINAVKYLQKLGFESIDVGCMQINLKHHPKAFKCLQDAFDPHKNINYAAQFLQKLKQETNSWHRAIGNYHSATPKLHKTYLDKVLKEWKNFKTLPTISMVDDQSYGYFNSLKDVISSPLADKKSISQLKLPPRTSNKVPTHSQAIMRKTFFPLNSLEKRHLIIDNKKTFIPLEANNCGNGVKKFIPVN